MNPTGTLGNLGPNDARRNAWLAWIGAPIALTGAQLISPSLPGLKSAFSLTEGELAMVMSIYLLPAAVAAIPLGLLADRFGRKVVYGSSAFVFGLCGIGLALVRSYELFLSLRFLQGVAVAGLVPLSMTILGDVYRGSKLIGAQGVRSVTMSLGDGIFPVVGGVLAGLAWFAPWVGQILAIPLGVFIVVSMVDPPGMDLPKVRHSSSMEALSVLKSPPIYSLQYAGFLRMFLKFAILTFLPVFLVDVRGESTVFAGLVVGVAALSGTAFAASSQRLARVWSITSWVVCGTLGMGIALFLMVTSGRSWAILCAAIVYGACDGMVGVFLNSFVTAAVGARHRAAFVAITGAIRNVAKFLGPFALAMLLFAFPLNTSFVVLSVITVASILVVRLISPLEDNLMDELAGGNV